MIFEKFPDEILLEICQYLSSADVLYSLFDLNARFNRTISHYCQHLVLRRTSFIQFEHLCLHILPKIGFKIRSLCINANWTDLLPKHFFFYFGQQMKEVFPNIEHLILIAFSGNELIDYMESISDLSHLNSLTIYDRYNVTEEYKRILFTKILSANQFRLKKVSCNHYTESLKINEMDSIIYTNITELSIHLERIQDFRCLLKLIPNIRQMSITLDKQCEDEIIHFDESIMINLIEFHMESFCRSWIFDEISSLLKQMPFLKYLSLDLFSEDYHLFNGQAVLSILPLNTLQRFNYAIDGMNNEKMESTDNIISSWAATPYQICCLFEDSKTHMFLHTIPYGFAYLDIDASFVKYMNRKSNDYNHHLKELRLFNVLTLAEILIILNHCRKVEDLTLEIVHVSSSK